MNILLFGGTSEGRELAEWFHGEGYDLTLCVATDYGAALAPQGVRTLTGRLDRAGMRRLFRENSFTCAVDATHPYAVEVTGNLRQAAQDAGIPCYRLLRDAGPAGDWLSAADMAAAAELAKSLTGTILLTTGSKELAAFAEPGLRERCYPRVLPSLDSLGHCLELGFPPAQILCMQGPFSRELNAALIRQYGIRVLVTKASGSAGGFGDKMEAAREAGCDRIVVERPAEEAGLSMAELKALLKEGRS